MSNTSSLPDNYLIKLANIGAISLSGEERYKYLQGQVTCDVNSLSEHPLLIGAHCNAKGKVHSCFRLIERQEQLLLIQPLQTIKNSLAELQKFGVFAKVEIKVAEQLSYYVLTGKDRKALLQRQFSQIPDSLTPVVDHNGITLVYLGGEIPRYLIIGDESAVLGKLQPLKLPTVTDAVWNYHEITEGFPCLTQPDIGEYVPQMLNLQAIHGISFTKGCYLGQETVARMQYLGKNKRSMQTLAGQLDFSIQSDSIVEMQIGENWRKAGDILCSYQDDKQTLLQMVLPSDVSISTNFRIQGHPEAILSLRPLPYSLTNQ
ncbi:tRNA-modifying protein YgfZ [Thalassotalea ganghwensis]